MTDRHCGYIVTLEGEIREDDSERVIEAIKQLRGVIDVQPVVQDIGHLMAVQQARHQFRKKLWDALDDKKR